MSVSGSTTGRNYADALLTLATRAGDPAGWGAIVRQIADAIESDLSLQRVLESPRIPSAAKFAIFEKALGDRVPHLMLRWLQAIVRNRRQMMLPTIANEYDTLLDEGANRVHARMTFATEPGATDVADVTARLAASLGKNVVPHVNVDPAIMGGIVVRVGDTIMDGSVRRRLQTMRRQMAGQGAR
jgi:F-type H+-transporting ATPase subunit delta